MGRWEPDARGRLSVAALDLYLERGFDQTTVADIAARAGVTERTFFRHFSDKREVLFDAGNLLQNGIVEAIASAPTGMTTIDTVERGYREGSGFLDEERRPYSRLRAAALDTTPALQERELLKLFTLRTAVEHALRERGVSAVEARVAAEAGAGCFSAAFSEWIDAHTTDDLGTCIQRAFLVLKDVAAG